MRAPRGIRNHNPGNLRHGPRWIGLEKVQLDREFAQFRAPEWGIRALAKLLLGYRRRGITTLRELVARYAPATENNCAAYEDALCLALGVRGTEAVDWSDPLTMRTLVAAIIRHENGRQPYTDAVLDEGLRRAGLEVPARRG